MTRRPSPKLAGFASVAAIFLVGALATGRPELVVMASPFAVILVAGLLTAEPPVWTTLSVDVERDRLVEGEASTLDVRIAAESDVERVEVVLPLPSGVAVEDVFVSEVIGRYIVSIVDATRSAPRVQVGASPRGSLALVKLARAKAVLAGREFVTPEDVKAVALPALAHRIALRPDSWVAGIKGEGIVQEVLDSVPAPPPEPGDGGP